VIAWGGDVTLINNTIANNSCNSDTSRGAGVYAGLGASIDGFNNIVYGNDAVNFPDIYGSDALEYTCCSQSLTGTGNITDDPLFVDPAHNDYNLQASSPCIDAGDPASPLDPDGTRADMGALYFDQGSTSPIELALTYVSGSPVPSGGGNLYFDVHLENVGSEPLDFDAWIDIAYQGGVPTTVVQRSFTWYLPGWAVNRPNTFFPVPGGYATGNYTFTGKAGIHPDNVWTESGFPFVKLGVSNGNEFQPWAVAGAPNPFEKIDMNDEIVLDKYGLLTAYPNPFNPETVISYQLSVISHVNLAVYDVAGRQIAELVDGWRETGLHDVTFDASNLPSGIYFALLSAGNYTQTQKLLLIK
jgi:hypothetical protein